MPTLRKKSRDGDSLEIYLREIDATPLLSAEDEKSLAYAIREGNSVARDTFIRSNLRLVVMFARRFIGRGLDLEDLIAAGNLGLIHGVKMFDPDRGCRFSTYGGRWILKSLQRAVDLHAPYVHVPSYISQLLLKWKNIQIQLCEQLGRQPDDNEISRRLNIDLKMLPIIRAALVAYKIPSSRSCALDDDPITAELHSLIVYDAESEIIRDDEIERIRTLIHRLPELESVVIRLRFGIDSDLPLSLRDISDRLGCSREAVKNLESRALDRLASALDTSREIAGAL